MRFFLTFVRHFCSLSRTSSSQLVIVKSLGALLWMSRVWHSLTAFEVFHRKISAEVHDGQDSFGPRARPFDHTSAMTAGVWSCLKLTALSLGVCVRLRGRRGPHGRMRVEWEQISTMAGPSGAAWLRTWIMHGRQWRARSISLPSSDPDEMHGGIDTAPHACLLNARLREIEWRGLLLPSVRSASVLWLKIRQENRRQAVRHGRCW